jgi:AraC-like DNA-binding protein
LEKNIYKYVTISEEDKEWGLHINVAGKATVDKTSVYPPQGHPSGYSFNYQQGRILNEYQINYITEGSGIFENSNGTFRIYPGTIIVIYPGEWHRYRPIKTTGWKEHYIGFDGKLASIILKPEFFNKQSPVLKVNFKKELQDTFYQILENVISEKAGYQQICAGLCIAYIGQIISILKNKEFEGKEIENKIQQACFVLRENLDKEINALQLAADLNIGYSHFRKMFKKYTGISPVQYHLQLRLKKAEDLLLMSDKTVKEIGFSLGFQSLFYFSRIFKQKTGMSPTAFRLKMKKNNNP